MESVDMAITQIRFSGRKSRSVNNLLQRLDYMAATQVFADFAMWNMDMKYTILLGGGAAANPDPPCISWG